MSYDPYNQGGYQPAQPVQAVPVGYGQYDPNAPAPMPQKMDAGAGLPTGDISFLGGKTRFYMKQRFEMLESLANALGFNAIEFSNKYDVFDADTGEPLLFAAEKSNCLCRACCKPNHTATLEVFDVRGGAQTPLFQMEKPFTLNCCTCFDICAQKQMTKITGTETIIGSATKRVPCGGYFTPTYDVADKTGNKDYTVTGPCCIVGGLIELFTDQEFKILDNGGSEAGRIVKMKPSEGMQGMQEAVGDADRFLIELKQGADPEKTANLISTLLMLDYAHFEGGPPCQFTNGQLQYNCFNIYCFGCLCPCQGTCGGGGGGDFGGAPAKEELEM